MKLVQKLVLLGLSFLLITPLYFAQSQLIYINDKKAIIDTKRFSNKIYIQLDALAKEAGYNIQYNNDNHITILMKDNNVLALTEEEIKMVNDRIYVPIARISLYFDDSIQVYEPAQKQLDPSLFIGKFEGNRGSMGFGIYTSDFDYNEIDSEVGGITLKIDNEELSASLITIGVNKYRVDNTKYKVEFYQENNVLLVDIYNNDEFVDCFVQITDPKYYWKHWY